MNLLAELERWLPAGVRDLVERTGVYADEHGLRCCLVGGVVRDLLLCESSLDIDIVVEGDAVEAASHLAGFMGSRSIVHREFGTATVPVGPFHIDFATARAESYERPGALPAVRPGTMEEDLSRRDFSVNAMAIVLNRERLGELLDPHSGRTDLAHGILRVLHPGSFVDDATRILRGVRYEQRLGFTFEAVTLELLERDVRRLDTISADRVRHEFDRTFDETEPRHALLRLDTLGALEAIDPALSFGKEQADALRSLCALRPGGPSVEAAMWCAFCWHVGPQDIDHVAARLNLPRRILDPLRDCRYLRSIEDRLAGDIRASETVHLLRERTPGSLLAARRLLVHPAARARVGAYIDHLRFVHSSVDGDALIEMGFPQGPSVGRVLERIRAARLDGEVSSRAEELELARSLLSGLT